MGKYGSILDLYDAAEDKGKQILSLCKLYKIPMADLKKIITDSGRELPEEKKKGPKPKKAAEGNNNDSALNNNDSAPEKAENGQKSADFEIILPEIVKTILIREMENLDMKIKTHQAAIDSYTKKYTAIANFIMNPLGRNLSQNESHCKNASDFSGGRKEDHVKEGI